MLRAFVFDGEKSQQVDDWRAALQGLGRKELLWLALREPSEDEEASLVEALQLGQEHAR